MTIKELLTTYFSQATLILGGIAAIIFYFIKRHFDLKSKKVETRYAVFQQSKIEAIKNYYNLYTNLQRALNSISTIRLVNQEYTAVELDTITENHISNLISADLALSIYFDGEILTEYNSVTKNILHINWLYQEGFSSIGTKDSNYLHTEYIKMISKNEAILKALGTKIRFSFNN